MSKLHPAPLLLAALLAMGSDCQPEVDRSEVKWIEVPDRVLTLGEAAALTVSGAGKLESVRIPLADSPLRLTDPSGLRLFLSTADRFEEVAFQAGEGEIRANLEAGQTYILYPPLRPRFVNAYDVLCRLRTIREPVRRILPDLIDPICLRILCPADPYFADELVREFEVLERFSEVFPPDELHEMELGPLDPRATGNICDQCTSFGRFDFPTEPQLIDCEPRLRPRLVVSVINIIPNAMSGETNQDSEPNVSVNPSDTDQVAASAFTPNPAGMGNAPYFLSSDGGGTWQICPVVQSNLSTSDITLRFTQTTGTLYAGILRRPGGLRLSIQSTDDFTCADPMTVQVDRLQVDQPYVQATDVGGEDRVYVGDNDFANQPRTATVDQTVDGAATWTTERLEVRATQGQDLPPIRPAIGPNNVVYAAFFGQRAGGAEVVVVRDDNGATGANPYRDLAEPAAPAGDGQAGVRVATGLTVPFENFSHANFGQERLVASDLSIAVHPNNAARVCVAWGDRVGDGDVLTLHLRCSTNSGQDWSADDMRTIRDAKAPALAINTAGTIGFLYQALEDAADGTNRWVTHFERVRPPGASTLLPQDNTVLADVPAATPVQQFIPYLGDYVHLQALGETFYGIFSANNTPDLGNFPQGVTYQREADFVNHELQDLDGNEVAVSIDPFFFIARQERVPDV